MTGGTPAPDELVATKRGRDIRAMFDEIAPWYDFLNHFLSLNIDQRWRRATAQRLMGPAVRRVLDVCGGTGDLALALAAEAKRQGGSAGIWSTDFTPSMTLRAKEKFRKSGPDLRTAVADTLCLPFPDGAFDVVTVAFGIRNVADTEAGLREMSRVCRAGGRVAVLEFSTPRWPVVREVWNFLFNTVIAWVGRLISGSKAYTYLPRSVAKFPSGDEFAAMLGRAAGGPVERKEMMLGAVTLYVATAGANRDNFRP